jgi:hypothetical protein
MVTDQPFTPKQVRYLKNELPNGSGASTQETDLNTDDIRAILQHTDIKGKAILLCLASGGMRIGELLQVRCADIDLTSIPARVNIRSQINGKRANKTGTQRYTFVSSEAVLAIREWSKIRGDYLKQTAVKAQNIGKTVNTDDERLFPLSDTVVNQLFKDAIIKTFGENQTDETTGRSTRHVHQLRKFFISQLAAAINSEPIADFFAGHKSPLSDNYRRYSAPQMAEKYLQGEHALIIEAPAEMIRETTENKKETARLKDTQLSQQSQLISLMNEKDAMRNKLQSQETAIQGLFSELEAQKARTDKILKLFEMLPSHAPIPVISADGDVDTEEYPDAEKSLNS